jgi:hypothetical protein
MTFVIKFHPSEMWNDAEKCENRRNDVTNNSIAEKFKTTKESTGTYNHKECNVFHSSMLNVLQLELSYIYVLFYGKERTYVVWMKFKKK